MNSCSKIVIYRFIVLVSWIYSALSLTITVDWMKLKLKCVLKVVIYRKWKILFGQRFVNCFSTRKLFESLWLSIPFLLNHWIYICMIRAVAGSNGSHRRRRYFFLALISQRTFRAKWKRTLAPYWVATSQWSICISSASGYYKSAIWHSFLFEFSFSFSLIIVFCCFLCVFFFLNRWI